MGLPYEHVNYDFGAADELAGLLAQAHGKLDAFIGHRTTQRERLLGQPGSDNWAGPRRDGFEGRFQTQQSALHDLAEELLRLKAAVEHATEQAHAANAHAR